MKKCLIHRKNASKVMVLMKSSCQEDAIAVIFVVVAWPEEAYEGDFDEKYSIDRKIAIVPVPDLSLIHI